MAYSTETDLQMRVSNTDLVELTTEEEPDPFEPDSDIVSEAIDAADEEIDSYVGVRFKTPLSPTPPRIKGVSRDIAIYNLYSRRPLIPLPDIINDLYKNAVKWLDKLSKGLVTPGDFPEPTKSEHVGGTVSQNTRVFTRDTMEGL